MAKAAPKRPRGGPSRVKRDEIVRTAQTAWRAIMGGKGDRWPYWSEVCPALRLCRDDAMRVAGLDPRTDETPTKNKHYSNAMTRALRDIGLHEIGRTSRKAAIECAPYLKQIAEWRELLRTSADSNAKVVSR